MGLSVEGGGNVDDMSWDAIDYLMDTLDVGELQGRQISLRKLAAFYESVKKKTHDLFLEDETFRRLALEFVRHCNTQWLLKKCVQTLLPEQESRIKIDWQEHKLSMADQVRKWAIGRDQASQTTQDLFLEEEALQELIVKFIRSDPQLTFKDVEVLTRDRHQILPHGLGHCLRKFWKKYKVPILIGVGVAAVVGAVVVVSIFTAGTASGVAAAAGSAALDQLNHSESEDDKSTEDTPKETTAAEPAQQVAEVAPESTNSVVEAPPVSPSASPSPESSMSGLWLGGQFYPYLSPEMQQDPVFIASLPIEYRPTSPSLLLPPPPIPWIHGSLDGRLFGYPRAYPESSPPPPHADEVEASSSHITCAADPVQTHPLIDPPAWLNSQPSEITASFPQFSWVGGALDSIGRNVIDNPALLDPSTPMLPSTQELVMAWNQAFAGVGDVLKVIGSDIVDNSKLFDPDALPITIPSRPSFSWINHALDSIGRSVIDSPALLDPNAPMLPPTQELVMAWDQTLAVIGDVLKVTGAGVVDNPRLFDPDALPLTIPSRPSFSWINNALDSIGRSVIDSPALLDPNAAMLPSTQALVATWNRTLAAIGNALTVTGVDIVDSPRLFDPSALPVTIPLRSSNLTIPGSFPSSFLMVGVNGMNTQEGEKNSHMAYLAQFAPEVTMNWVYNRTHGVTLDLAEIFSLNYGGNSPNTGELLLKNWTDFHQEHMDMPGAKLLQFCHSQGAIHVRNELMKAPPEIRNRVIVIAIAPAAVVSREICYDSFNYACKTDLIPQGEVFYEAVKTLLDIREFPNLQRALRHRKELVLLDALPGSSGLNHDFQNPVFYKKIEDHIKMYLEQNGHYK